MLAERGVKLVAGRMGFMTYEGMAWKGSVYPIRASRQMTSIPEENPTPLLKTNMRLRTNENILCNTVICSKKVADVLMFIPDIVKSRQSVVLESLARSSAVTWVEEGLLASRCGCG